MKNPSTFITKDGVSDAGLIPAARDLYKELENCLAIVEHEASLGPTIKYRRDIATARCALSKARGEA